MGMYVWEKHTTYSVQYYPWFQASTGGLGMYPPTDKRGLRYHFQQWTPTQWGQRMQTTNQFPLDGIWL